MRIGRTTGHNGSSSTPRVTPTAAAGTERGAPETPQPAGAAAKANLPVPLRAQPRTAAGQSHRVRSSSAFLAQLIAGNLGLAQTRAKRRNGTAETIAAYSATAGTSSSATGRRLSRRA